MDRMDRTVLRYTSRRHRSAPTSAPTRAYELSWYEYEYECFFVRFRLSQCNNQYEYEYEWYTL